MIATRTPTVEEFLRSGDNERCEFVRGERIEKPMPTGPHSDVQTVIVAALHEYFRRTGHGKVRPEWHHRFGPADDIRVYVPDVAVLLAPRHLDAPAYADSPSNIIIEILSPSQPASVWIEKVQFYLHNGVQGVWIVDPDLRRVNIYSPGKPIRRFEGSDILKDDLLPGFELPLTELFPGT